MEWKKIKDGCFYFDAPVNIGYIVKGKTGMLVDAGIDKGTAKKVMKALAEKELPLTDIFITHAHADHFGGAAWLKKQQNVKVHAPELESAVLENPRLEPIYLFHGAEPPEGMRSKFLEGPPVMVDQIVSEGVFQAGEIQGELLRVPGHSHNQLAFISYGVLYGGDSYFAHEYLRKHRIPFMVDVRAAVQSLERLLELEAEGAVPGHGTYEENFKETVSENLKFHNSLLNDLALFIKKEMNGMNIEALTAQYCTNNGVQLQNIGSWALYRTAVTAYVMALVQEKRAALTIMNNELTVKESDLHQQ
ncbi:MBL fold metallo-hydrolase [Alteribacillus sp. HJP-4]|uniref:MBL fold metallo-hydrolase n=1 Tax=Alteribacillus sp. HJP-4 TaxID=2775394 RepID=UPI0035CCF251